MTLTKEQFEREVIRGLISGFGTAHWMNQLKEDSFEIIQMRRIFGSIKVYFDEYSECPQADVLVREIQKKGSATPEELKNIEAFLTRAEPLSQDRFDYVAKELLKEYEARILRLAIKDAVDCLQRGDTKRAQDILLSRAVELNTGAGSVRITDFVGDFEKRKDSLLKIRENPDLLKEGYIPTGIQKLDIELDGGLRKGELLIILAPPEGGKSIAMQDMAVSGIESGYRVAYFTIEMTPEQTSSRMDARLSQTRYRKFRRNLLSDVEIEEWERQIKMLPSNMLKIIGAYEGCSSRLIESELMKMRHTFQPDLILVDYAGIMSTNDGVYQDTMDWKYLGTVIKNLKSLSLKMNIPVVSACQLLVGSKEKERVTMSDIGLARQQIAAHCDVAVAIVQTDHMKAMDLTKLQLLKCREGAENRVIDITSDYDRISLVRRTEVVDTGDYDLDKF